MKVTLKTSEKNPEPIFSLWKSSRRLRDATACLSAWHEDPVLRVSHRALEGSDSSLLGQNNFSLSFGSHGESYKHELLVKSLPLVFVHIIKQKRNNYVALTNFAHICVRWGSANLLNVCSSHIIFNFRKRRKVNQI